MGKKRCMLGGKTKTGRKGNQIPLKFFVDIVKIKVLTSAPFVRYNKLCNKKPFFCNCGPLKKHALLYGRESNSVSYVGS